MIKVDWSGVLELAAKYDARAAEMKNNPFGDNRKYIAGALKQSLREALDMGKLSQSAQDEHYASTGTGYYGSYGEQLTNQGLVNPQETLDPGGLQRALSRNRISPSSQSFHGSAAGIYRGTDNGSMTIDLTTKATMTPYPNRNPATGELTFHSPTRSLAYYLRHGWVDDLNRNHRMNSRRKFFEYVIDKFKPYVRRLSPMLMRMSGFLPK